MPNTSAKKFEKIVDRVGRVLMAQGYRRRKMTFVAETPEVFRLIEFQRSRDRLRNAVKFTINLGVMSKALLRMSGESRELAGYAGHVFKRVGLLLPKKEDTWWTIREESSEELVWVEMIGVLELAALPFLRRFESDADLRRYFWQEVKAGNASYDDVLHLCMLEADKGSADRFRKALVEFKSIAREVGFSVNEIASKAKELEGFRDGDAGKMSASTRGARKRQK